MQTIKRPDAYDWSGFTSKPYGFVADWCRAHHYEDGTPFNYFTTKALIHGNYGGGSSGPRISGIIQAALKEGLIREYKLAA